MYRSLLPGDLFAESTACKSRCSRPSTAFRPASAVSPAATPRSTPAPRRPSVEICALAPGIDPAKLEVNLERGVLTTEGEREPAVREGDGKATAHVNERFEGSFRRVVNLPDDVDPSAIKASYRDGVLQVSLRRRESAQPRRIEVQ